MCHPSISLMSGRCLSERVGSSHVNRKYAQVPSCTARISILDSPLPSKFPPWLVITENGWMLRQARSDVSPSRMGASALLVPAPDALPHSVQAADREWHPWAVVLAAEVPLAGSVAGVHLAGPAAGVHLAGPAAGVPLAGAPAGVPLAGPATPASRAGLAEGAPLAGPAAPVSRAGPVARAPLAGPAAHGFRVGLAAAAPLAGPAAPVSRAGVAARAPFAGLAAPVSRAGLAASGSPTLSCRRLRIPAAAVPIARPASSAIQWHRAAVAALTGP